MVGWVDNGMDGSKVNWFILSCLCGLDYGQTYEGTSGYCRVAFRTGKNIDKFYQTIRADIIFSFSLST